MYRFAAAGLLVTLAAWLTFAQEPNQKAGSRQPKVSWEYCERSFPHGFGTTEEMNRLGNDGWELVAVVAAPEPGYVDKNFAYFKRQKQGQ